MEVWVVSESSSVGEHQANAPDVTEAWKDRGLSGLGRMVVWVVSVSSSVGEHQPNTPDGIEAQRDGWRMSSAG